MSKKKVALTAEDIRHKALVARLSELPDSIFLRSLFGPDAWECSEEERDALAAGAPWAPILRAHGVQ